MTNFSANRNKLKIRQTVVNNGGLMTFTIEAAADDFSSEPVIMFANELLKATQPSIDKWKGSEK